MADTSGQDGLAERVGEVVERLRNPIMRSSGRWMEPAFLAEGPTRQIMNEAASLLQSLSARLSEAEGEVGRMRGALEKIAASGEDDESGDRLHILAKPYADIARAALSPREPGE